MKTFQVLCGNEYSAQHFQTVASLLCNDVDIQIIENQQNSTIKDNLREVNHVVNHVVNNERHRRRKALDTQALCFDAQTGQELSWAKAINISDNGICLNVARPITAGSSIRVKVMSRNPFQRNKETEGRVVWSRHNKIGVQFLKV